MCKYASLLFASAMFVCGHAKAASPAHTLCDLAANLDKYADQIVRVKAIYSTDMFEYSKLLDPNCRSVRISLYDGPSGPYQGTIDKFDNALSQAKFAGRPVTFRVEFSAVLRLRPEPTENPFAKGELGRLHLTRIWHYSWLPKIPAKH